MIGKVVRIVAELSGIDDFMLYSRSHDMKTCTVKYMCWYYLHKEKRVSISSLVKHFSRVKSVIYHGIERVGGFIEYDSDFRKRYDAIKCELEERLKKD